MNLLITHLLVFVFGIVCVFVYEYIQNLREQPLFQRYCSRFETVLVHRAPTNKDIRDMGSYWIDMKKEHLWICMNNKEIDNIQWFNISTAYKKEQQ